MTITKEVLLALEERITADLKRAFNLGQTYWQQADSESIAQQNRSDKTRAKFDELLGAAIASLRASSLTESGAVPVAQEDEQYLIFFDDRDREPIIVWSRDDARKLLQSAIDLFGEDSECLDASTDAWEWLEQARALLALPAPRTCGEK